MDKLPERHFPLQNLELERTDLFTSEGSKSKPLILFGLRGPGGMNCLWPVIEQLQKEDYPIDLLIDSAAKRILETKDSSFSQKPPDSPLKRLMELKPAVAVTESSSGEGVALTVEWSEEGFNTPTVAVEDYPGSTSYPQLLKINPTYICVQNKIAKQMVVNKRPTMNPDNIVVTGHPDFDRYSDTDKEKVRNETRGKLEVEDSEFLVVYSGQLPPETPDILEHVVDGLNNIKTDKKLVLLFSRHPRDTSDESIYQNILSKFRGKIVNQEDISSDDIGFASDLLLTMTSTEGLKSAYRRVPSIHIMPKELMGDYPEDRIPFPVRANASLGVDNYGELINALKKSIDDDEFRRGQIESMTQEFKSDGKAAERVAEVIIRAASESGTQ